jgi:hypothetical protein
MTAWMHSCECQEPLQERIASAIFPGVKIALAERSCNTQTRLQQRSSSTTRSLYVVPAKAGAQPAAMHKSVSFVG